MSGDPENTRPEAELEETIKHYLAEHPRAMDTLGGIAEWWVMRQRIRVDLEALNEVLSRLTEQGFLERIGSGGDARYRLRTTE